MAYTLHVLSILLIQCVLTLSLDLLVVQTGFFSLAHAVHFGVGAYTAALLMKAFGVPLLLAFPAAMLAGVVSSVFVTAAMNRLTGDLFTVATIALQVLFTSFATNLEQVTGGPFGISEIPRPLPPELFRWVFVAAMFGVVAACWQLRSFALTRPLGYSMLAVRTIPEWIASMGINPATVRAAVSAVSAGLAGLSGACYAVYFTYIDPFSFTLAESIATSTALLVGGVQRRWGPILGAMFVVLMPEALRFTGLSSPQIAYARQLFVGIVLIATAATYSSRQSKIGAQNNMP